MEDTEKYTLERSYGVLFSTISDLKDSNKTFVTQIPGADTDYKFVQKLTYPPWLEKMLKFIC